MDDPTAAGQAKDFEALSREFLDWFFRSNPVTATFLGVHDYDDKLGEFSPEAIEQQLREGKQHLEALRAVDRAQLGETDRVDYELLEGMLEVELRLHEDLFRWKKDPRWAATFS